MGVDLGSIYFEFGEPVKTMGVYNEVELHFKKKISERRASWNARRIGTVLRDYSAIKGSSDAAVSEHIMIDILTDNADMDDFEIQNRKRLEGAKGWAVYGKTSFKNSPQRETNYYFVPYTVKETKLIELVYLEPVEKNPEIDDLILGVRSKSLYRALQEFEENLNQIVIHCVDIHDIPRESLANAKKPNNIVNEKMGTLFTPISQSTLDKFDSALNQTLDTLSRRERNIAMLNFGPDNLAITQSTKVGEETAVLDALKAIVAEVKRRKQTAIIDTSW